ncbi:transport and Golgi organization protein 2 homolog [Montipora foliosa]|uniref:transport and Golgi organization protein 2 homolog n=1 Tax=Montipora foliosa TaxID=591990 RepID=UPI0035F1EA60
MCILFLYFCHKPEPYGYRLIIASNRDEYYSRPTARARYWDKNPNILAGMDLEPGKEGGTWLGVNKNGNFAAVTNYRQAPQFLNSNAVGRGHLVPDFLEENIDVKEYLQRISNKAVNYNGFNLLVGKLSLSGKSEVGYYGNIEEMEIKMLSPGIHVLSNKVLNCSWPKMVYGRKRFASILAERCSKQELIDKLIKLLCVKERSFSCGDKNSFIGSQDDKSDENHMKFVDACQSIFVNYEGKRYGTRTNTVVLVDAQGHATYVERTMEDGATDPDEAEWRTSSYEFDIQDTYDGLHNAKETHQLKQPLVKSSKDEFTERLCKQHKKQGQKRFIDRKSSHLEPATKVFAKE